MEPVNGLERMVGELEKILISHQQETEKLKKIKTEEAMEKDTIVEAYVERIKGLREEISGLKLQSWMDKETIKEIMLKNAKANQTVEELSRKVEELEDRVSALEEENRTTVRVWEEMKVRETDSEWRLEGLERQKLEADKRMNEMMVRESDLRRQILEADDRVKEMEGRVLEACKAAEENIKRFGNVLPIAEDLWKLLKMNVDDLVSVKEKFGFSTDEEGLISSSVVSGDSRAGAITINVVAGPHARNKAVEELTVSATEQPTKQQKTNESLIKRKWIFGADMMRAFEEDDELCLHAVCALYRQRVSTSKSTESSNKRFYHFEALRGVELVGCLTGGDPEHSSLTMRPVDEVKQENPDIVNQCRRLAICYSSYFTAMPRTNEPLSRSLSLVCCDRYVTHRIIRVRVERVGEG